MKKMLLLTSAVLLLGACASTRQVVPLPDMSQPPSAESGKARIFVMRPTAFGGAIKMTVSDNASMIGTTGPQGYLCWDRDAGEMQLAGKAENTSILQLTVEAGKTYYVQQDVKMGCLVARNQLAILDEGNGRSVLARCKPPRR